MNPGSKVLSTEMVLRRVGWAGVANLVISSIKEPIPLKKVMYDLAHPLEGATQVSCSSFGQAMINNM